MNKKLMILATATVALATMSCTGNAESNATGGDTTATEQTTEAAQADPVWDIDFPKNLKIDVEQGQNVLVHLRRGGTHHQQVLPTGPRTGQGSAPRGRDCRPHQGRGGS